MTTSIRISTAFSALLTGLLTLTGCTEHEVASDRYVAFTPNAGGPDAVAGVALELESSHHGAALELEDGEVVDLELGAAQGADLLGACADAFADSDRAVLPVLSRPLAVGDFSFEAPVLEVACDPATATNRLVLREEGDADCADGECLDFTAPGASESSRPPLAGDLPMTGEEAAPSAGCAPVGTRVCVSCGGGQYRPRTVTYSHTPHPNYHCVYEYSYGPCSFICED